MLYGTTGRTDLLGAEHTEALTHAQFHSVRRLAAELPDKLRSIPPTASAASARPPRPAATRPPSPSSATSTRP